MPGSTPHPIYFASMQNGRRFLVRDAEPVPIHSDIEFVVHRSIMDPGSWTVTHADTGMRVATNESRDRAIELASECVCARFDAVDVMTSLVEGLEFGPSLSFS